MPRINVTDEELAALERIRNKHREIVGWNAAIAQVALLFETGALWAFPDGTPLLESSSGMELNAVATDNIKRNLSALKKDLPL